jgi:hypothetical protein
MIDVFIPSYHRAKNLKTVHLLVKLGYDPSKIHVFIDSEADDRLDYVAVCKRYKCHLYIFDMWEARERFDYVHRPSVSRRSGGQARNMFADKAKELGIDFYVVSDDDSSGYQVRPFGRYIKSANIDEINRTFLAIKEMMQKHRIGLFGLSQTGDMFEKINTRILRQKVMNTTFYDTRFIYRGERGVSDDDTSQFVGVLNEGYFTGSMATGIVLSQTPSATAKGGLTDLYNEYGLLSKSLIIPIQFPSLCVAERQTRNGGRLHHKLKYKNLAPKILKGERSNLAWDTYPEDVVFTNEPKNRLKS